MSNHWTARCVKAIAALAAAAALSCCIVYPYGPRYGYYYRPHPAYLY